MPQPPAGEQDLQDHALRFARAEGAILAHLGYAATDDRAAATRRALQVVTALRTLDHRTPVVAAYLHEHPLGRPDAVRDLAGSLARRLDIGAQTAADSIRATFARVTTDNLNEAATAAVTAAVDRRGVRWSLGRWADMQCTTIGRQATSRGIADQVGEGNTVTVNTGDCDWCQSHAGDAVIGTNPLPPYHPNCSCTATRA
jgi:hypothetical protein